MGYLTAHTYDIHGEHGHPPLCTITILALYCRYLSSERSTQTYGECRVVEGQWVEGCLK